MSWHNHLIRTMQPIEGYELHPAHNATQRGLTEYLLQRYTGKSFADVQKKTRKMEIKDARQIYHAFYLKVLNFTEAKTGQMIGMKDHATVNHSVKVVRQRIETDKEFRQMIQKICDGLRVDMVETFDVKVIVN